MERSSHSKGVLPVKNVRRFRRRRGDSIASGPRFFPSLAGLICPILALTLLIAPERASAQGTQLAVIDIAKVFRDHPRLAQQRDEFQRESSTFEAYMQQEKNKLDKMDEQLREYKPGTQQYRDLEKQLATSQAEFEVRVKLKVKEMQEREATIQFQTYIEIRGLVGKFCQRHGLSMVLRFNSEPIDQNDARAIQAGLNRRVIFHRNLDITDHILAELKQGVPPAGSVSSLPQIPPRR